MENDLTLSAPMTSTFRLEYEDGCLVDGEQFSDLDRARDVAFEINLEENVPIVIRRSYGGRLFDEEVVG